jgi:2,3-bisphosphoglycerate-dependent phosphoglycerate mutase
MTTLLLVRHGETDWNASGRLQGHTDQVLNDLGRRQAVELADRLANDGVAALYASDLARARETAEILGRGWSFRS